jgi:hypothetical protein
VRLISLRATRVQKFAPESTATLSPVRFESKSYGIAPISCNFQRNAGGFLCNPDCVAEGEGFEPSVRFCRAKPRPFRKLQIAKAQQRISHKNLPSKPCNQSGLDSLSIRNFKANARRFCGCKWSLRNAAHGRVGSHVTACSGGQSTILKVALRCSAESVEKVPLEGSEIWKVIELRRD